MFFKKKAIFAIFGLLLIVTIILIVSTILLWSKYKGSPQNITAIPDWQGIIPGRTSVEEVIQIMGQPDQIEGCIIQSDTWSTDLKRCFNGHLIYKYTEQSGSRFLNTHEVHFLSELVWFVEEDISHDSHITVEDFVAQYGLPERVTWSTVPSYLNAVLFCEHGVILHASIDRVEKIFYFEPISLDKCLQVFSNEVVTENPFAGTDIIKAEDPWGFNQRR